MSDQNLMCIDIEPRSNISAPEKPIWTRSDNSFQFDFFTDASPSHQEKTPPSFRTSPTSDSISFTGQGTSFAFNFHIPPAASEEMETAGGAGVASPRAVQDEQPPLLSPESNSAVKSKTKKKKKSGKKKPSNTEPQQQQEPQEESEVREEPSAEEQLNRQLDWCIEQLELRLGSQKGTAKQNEEASRALKTLRSSKAPLVKKRQVMRAMSGDYRKQMEDEKAKQFKLIQSEMASAQLKVVSALPKKSVFHRKAEVKTHTQSAEEKLPETGGQTQEETTHFVFVPTKEEFQFNFL